MSVNTALADRAASVIKRVTVIPCNGASPPSCRPFPLASCQTWSPMCPGSPGVGVAGVTTGVVGVVVGATGVAVGGTGVWVGRGVGDGGVGVGV